MEIQYTVDDDKKEKHDSITVEIKVPSMISTDKEFSHKSDDVIYTFYTRNILDVDSIITNFKHELSGWLNMHRSLIIMKEVSDFN
jgi:hypothetical protein